MNDVKENAETNMDMMATNSIQNDESLPEVMGTGELSEQEDTDVDYTDEDEDGVNGDDDDNQGDVLRNGEDRDAKKSPKIKSKKRKRNPNKRRNIRKVFKPNHLDAKTIDAQEQEKERLRRLEQQRSMPDAGPSRSSASNDIAEIDSEMLDSSNLNDSVIILDDDIDSEFSEEDSCNNKNIILISSSDNEGDSEPDDDNQIDSSDDLGDSIETLHLKNKKGQILVNPNHPVEEPDLFLPSKIASVIKPHQVAGIRFLYENLIESLKHFRMDQGFGCVLAHSMGLGKTIQTISLIHVFLKYTPAKNVLIVVPINTLQNWLCEYNMWLPENEENSQRNDLKQSSSEKITTPCNSSEQQNENYHPSPSVIAEVPKGNEAANSLSKEESKVDTIRDNSKDIDEGKASGNEDIVTEVDSEMKNTETNASSYGDNNSEIDIDCRDYKVFLIGDGQKTTISRAKVIGQWHQDGGVLLMGYEMYRGISMYTPSLCNSVTNAKGKKKKQKAKKSAAVIDIEEEEKEMQLFMGMQRALCQPGPDLVVCDEGHRIKNHQSNIHTALHKIKTRKRLVLTGYPLQNNLTEYWCMVDFVRPNYLGSRQEFQNMFERPITNGQCVDSTAADKKLMKYRAHVLSSLLKGFVQRRGYTALKNALPPKREHVIMVRLSSVQQAVYRRFIDLMQEGFGEQLNPIKIFAVCSKIWNHPDILYKAMKADESKHVDLFDTDEDVGPDDKPKPKSMKNNSKSSQNAPNYVSEEGLNPFGGDARSLLLKITDWAKEVFESHAFKEGLIETSGKFVVLLEIINESLARDDKILVFSQSLTTLDLIEELLGRSSVTNSQQNSSEAMDRKWKKNVDYYRIDGSTPAVERERLIDAFNSKENTQAKLFMLSTRAGCLGINLIGANRVIVFDVSWNPCHDAQAVCRVYRYGQQKPCYIYRLVASNTMEKRMYYRQISKQGVSDRVIDELNPIENFTKEEVNKLLSTTWEDEPEIDYTEECKNYDDPVLQEICRKCGNLIVMAPFKHESLLEDQEHSRLSRADKKQAKRAYEEEKRKAQMMFNGPASFRGAYNAQRPVGQGFPILQQPYLAPNTQFIPNPALFGQHALYGNPMARPIGGTSADLSRIRSIIAQYNALKGREHVAHMTSQHQAPEETNGDASDIITPSQTLASISALRAGLLGQFYAHGAANMASAWNTGGDAEERAVAVAPGTLQTTNQHMASTNSPAPSNHVPSGSTNENVSGQDDNSNSLSWSRNDSEVICLDTDDEDEA